MESSASLRSFHYVGTVSHPQSSLEMPGMVSMYYASKSDIQGLTFGGKLFHASRRQRGAPVSCVKSSESTEAVKPNGSLDSLPNRSLEKKPLQNVIFPSGFEALVLEVCDETQIAELKLKVGEFEMHLKRNIGVTKAPLSGISPTTPPPIPTKPMVESAPSAPSPSPPKSSPKKTSPFTNPFGNSSKLAALEASGAKGYVLVPSPTVGSFHRGRTVKGRRQPPICKEGDLIKEGQVIGYLDQFGTELPVKSDVAGEVLKLLFNEGDAVGYGDPLIAVLPAFHGIN